MAGSCWAFHQHWNGLRCSIDSFTTGWCCQHTCQTKKVCMWVICGHSQFSECIHNQNSSVFCQRDLQALKSSRWWLTLLMEVKSFQSFLWKISGGGNLVRISGLCTVFIVCFLTDTIYTHQCFICFIIEHASGFVRNALSAYMLLITEALMLSILLLRHVLLLPLYLPFYRVTASMHYKNLLMKYIHCGIACLATCSMKEIMYIGSNHTGWRIQL